MTSDFQSCTTNTRNSFERRQVLLPLLPTILIVRKRCFAELEKDEAGDELPSDERCNFLWLVAAFCPLLHKQFIFYSFKL